jgi:hypothetical protein
MANRHARSLVVGALVFLATSGLAQAQFYSGKTVRIIVGGSAGGEESSKRQFGRPAGRPYFVIFLLSVADRILLQ